MLGNIEKLIFIPILKIPNSKHQITNNFQIPKTNDPKHVWYFGFRSRAAQALAPRVEICLIFGIWPLEFAALKNF